MTLMANLTVVADTERFKLELIRHDYLDPLFRLTCFSDMDQGRMVTLRVEDAPALIDMLKDGFKVCGVPVS